MVVYFVSLAVVIPVSGWLGDRWGTKRIFLIALALFSFASALCGLAGNLPMLVLFRMLQGAGGGALAPVGTAMLYRTFPPAERVQISRVLIVPIGIAACLFGLVFLYEHHEPTAGRFDLPGFLLGGTGLTLALYALSKGPSTGWSSFTVLASSLGGLLTLSAFAVYARALVPCGGRDGLRVLASADRRLCDHLVRLHRASVSPLQCSEATGSRSRRRGTWRCNQFRGTNTPEYDSAEPVGLSRSLPGCRFTCVGCSLHCTGSFRSRCCRIHAASSQAEW